jgi:recombinase
MSLKHKQLFPGADGKDNAPPLRAVLSHPKEGLMERTERIRQSASDKLSWDAIQKFQSQGWKLVALEWERSVNEEKPLPEEVSPQPAPFGLRVVPDSATLVEDRSEGEILVTMMELIIQDGPYSGIAEELNRRGYRTREGSPWSPVSVFEMLPRLIDAGPRILSSENWRRRRQESQPRPQPPII